MKNIQVVNTSTAAPPIRCVTYSRISLDTQGTGLGVSRQSEANRKLAAERGWEIVHEYVDNDISATDRRKVRPAYNAMVESFHRGEFQALVCWDLDRLTRQPRQLEDWIDAAEAKGLLLTTANGEADLTNDGGRLFARIKLAVARGEVERKSARQKAAHSQRAASGNPWKGSRRAFGFEVDGVTHHPDEAPLVPDMYWSLLRGSSLTSIAATLNRAEALTTQAKPWTPQGVRQFLQNPRNAGLLAHHDKVVGKGQWEPLIGEDEWRTVNGIISSNPHTRERSSQHLLSLLAVCGLCNTPMTTGYRHNKTRIYRCPDCTKISRNADHLDAFVAAVVIARLNRPDANELLVDSVTPDVRILQDQAQMLRLRLEQIAEAFADGDIGPAEWKASRERANARLADVEAQMATHDRAPILRPLLAADAGEVWAGLDVDKRRAVIGALLRVVVQPTRRGSQFDPAHIDVEWTD